DYYIGLSQLYVVKASRLFDESLLINSDVPEETQIEKQKQAKNFASQAESLAVIATQRDPQNFQSWSNLGLIFENTNFLVTNKTQAAIDAYEKAKKLAPNNFEIYFSEGALYEKIGDTEKAIADYEQAFALNPNIEGLAEKIQSLKN
ncbi:MAG: tetratricopeptide repeat protein, partial [Candidatus Pacebacteria bacterium]|nr:tetratricopeptide repeat protein [Candidatus Paceibacterota bacterium]